MSGLAGLESLMQDLDDTFDISKLKEEEEEEQARKKEIQRREKEEQARKQETQKKGKIQMESAFEDDEDILMTAEQILSRRHGTLSKKQFFLLVFLKKISFFFLISGPMEEKRSGWRTLTFRKR